MGRDWDFVVAQHRAGDVADGGLQLRAMSDADTPALAVLHRREPVRWLRPPSDFLNALKGHVIGNL